MEFVSFRDSLFSPGNNNGMYVHDMGYDPVSDWVINSKIIYEHYVLMMISPLLSLSHSIVDLGCHVGTYSYAAQLLNKSILTLSIDTNDRNLEICKINSLYRKQHVFLHGFWDSTTTAEHVYVNDPKKSGHQDLYASLSKEYKTAAQVKVPIIGNQPIIEFLGSSDYLEPKFHFIKIDVDGGEVDNAVALIASIIKRNIKFYIMIETADHSTFVKIKKLGLTLLGLLPGNNFVFCTPTLVETMSTSIFLSSAASYLNLIIENEETLKFLNSQGSYKVQQSVNIITPFGKISLNGKILNKYWEKLLQDENIPIMCYG